MSNPKQGQENENALNPSPQTNLVDYVSKIYDFTHSVDVNISYQLYDITQKYRLFYFFSKVIEFLSDTIALPLFFLLYSIEGNPSPFTFTAFAMSCVLFGEFILKKVFHRKRPIWGKNSNGYAFPSSHSLAAGIIVGILIALPLQSTPPFLLFALLVPLNRIMLGHHYVIDVLMGFSIGISITAIWLYYLMPMGLP